MKKVGLDPKTDVKSFFQGFTMDPFIANQYPVAQVTSWDELQTLIEAGIPESSLTIFKPSDYGVGILHGSLIATEKMINDHPDALKKFVQATIKGWQYAYAHPDEAVQIVLESAPKGDSKQHETDQLKAMENIQWPNGTEPANWGQIPMNTYQQNAAVVQDAGNVVTKPIDVSAAVDTSIAGGS
jgi:NitT/TauT family transport system substrate-binding protein